MGLSAAAVHRTSLRIAFLSPWRHDDPSSWSGMIHNLYRALANQEETEVRPWYTGDVRPVIVDRFLERVLGPWRGGTYRAQLGALTARKRARAVAQLIKQDRPDVILAVVASTDAAFLRTTVPVVHATDATFDLVKDFYPDTTGLHRLATIQASAVDRQLNASVAAHIVNNGWAARGLSAEGVPSDRVHVVPFGPGTDTSDASSSHGPPSHSRKILLVASNWQRKAGDRVVATVERARKELGAPPQLTVVGSSPSDLPDWVDALGRVPMDRMPDLYKSHDILIDLADANAAGVTLTDAHAHGLPTIATDVGGVSDIVEDGVTGILVTPERAIEEAVAAIHRLQDDVTWNQMSTAARERSTRILNWETWGITTRRILGEVHRQANNAQPRKAR